MDHALLLFNFEKKYFDKENIANTFVGHPLLEKNDKTKTDLSNMISKDKKIISLFAGSRSSETNLLLPILIDFIKLMNEKFNYYLFVFHATEENKNFINVIFELFFLKTPKINKNIIDKDIKISGNI